MFARFQRQINAIEQMNTGIGDERQILDFYAAFQFKGFPVAGFDLMLGFHIEKFHGALIVDPAVLVDLIKFDEILPGFE